MTGRARPGRSLVIALALCFLAPPGKAAAEPPRQLSYDLTADGIVTGGVLAGALALVLLKGELAPLACGWCAPGSVDGDLARSALWSSPHAADTASSVLSVVLPAGMLGYGILQAYRLDDPRSGWADVLLVTEAASIAVLLDAVVKYAVGRARPYVWLGQPQLYDNPSDRNLSFFSSHTTFTFAVAVSAGTLFIMQGLPGAPVVLGAGLALAAFTGYLRMAAGQHYLSDVLVGAAVGSLVGWAVPYLFHRPADKAAQPGALMAAPGGLAIAW